MYLFAYPGLSLRSNRGLKLANAFGVCSSLRLFLVDITLTT